MDNTLLKQAGALPNIFGYLRIFLIPEFIWLSLSGERVASLLILIISAVSDMLDGQAARRLGLTTAFGRMLDPLADKLTQLAVVICLAAEYRQAYYLFIVLAAKEISAAVCSAALLRSGGSPFNSMWFGKISTGALYVYSGLLIAIRLKDTPVLLLTAAVSVIVLLAFILYTFEFMRRIIDLKNEPPYRL
jgi:cardiolipin synthase